MSTETGKKKFGPWLLEQAERQDAIGAMARAWKQLKETNNYGRVHTAKSIGQLLSARLGEDWQRLNGDEVISTAEKEWNASLEGAAETWTQEGQGTIFDLPGGAAPVQADAGYTEFIDKTVRAAAPQMAVLVVDGREYELTPGRRYVLDFGHPVLRDVEGFEQTSAAEPAPVPVLLADGRLNWDALYRGADLAVVEE